MKKDRGFVSVMKRINKYQGTERNAGEDVVFFMNIISSN